MANVVLLNPQEAAERLRCSLSRVYALSSSGAISKYKLGNRLFISEADLEDYIRSCHVETQENGR